VDPVPDPLLLSISEYKEAGRGSDTVSSSTSHYSPELQITLQYYDKPFEKVYRP
jgi:hypothetical protein